MTYDAWRTTFMLRKKYRIEYFIKHTFLVIHVEIFFPYSRTPRFMRDFWYRCLFRAKCAFCRALFALFFLVVFTLIWIRRREKALDIFSCFSPSRHPTRFNIFAHCNSMHGSRQPCIAHIRVFFVTLELAFHACHSTVSAQALPLTSPAKPNFHFADDMSSRVLQRWKLRRN